MAVSSPKFRIAISGGGIGGLALAAFICKHSKDVAVDIYETKTEISVIGAGIAIWKRTWQTLQDIGLEDEVRKRGLPLPKEGEIRGPIFRKADQPSEGVDFHNHMMPYGPLTLPRPTLLELLQTTLTDMCKIHTSKHVASYEETPGGPITIHFKDGSSSTADVLVGCDGVHSNTRATMYRDLAKTDPSKGYESFCEPKWSGQLAYRTVIPKTKISEKDPNHQALTQAKIWCGKNKHAVTHPFGDTINVICFYNEEGGYGKPFTAAWVADVPTAEVVDRFQNWESDILKVLQAIENPSRWAIHVVDRLPYSVAGHVALVGDAAHAMTPHQGVGGGQAIEDAHILGRLLAHEKTTVHNLKEVLEIYQAIRLPLAQKAAERSWNNGLLYDFIHPDHSVKADATPEELKSLGLAVGEAFAWLGKGGCDEDWTEAESRLLQLN
ncbi:hypothetical protein E1B28_006596 [Marasmius oreades]|uniref:FAD-binding domain-containing protein n=1 Tax=Marasmius oreades TaxID=181124 RepID=A0A9P7UWG4_9AGAR|nr:uncharacterized protein E1B28_006596 [Marasmius oreades]KAG7095911.1 hypothetical protein E1B28_006596 [Marasmius oreades]